MNSNKYLFKKKPYLLLASVFHGIQVYAYVSGMIYYTAEAREAIYTGFPVMRYIDHGTAALILTALFMQFLTAVQIRKDKPASRGKLGVAYGILLVSQIGYVSARRIVTGLTPFTYSSVLQVALYALLLTLVLCVRDSDMNYGDNNEGKQDIVCSDPVLQGTGSTPGNGESTETENDGSDGQGSDCDK